MKSKVALATKYVANWTIGKSSNSKHCQKMMSWLFGQLLFYLKLPVFNLVLEWSWVIEFRELLLRELLLWQSGTVNFV